MIACQWALAIAVAYAFTRSLWGAWRDPFMDPDEKAMEAGFVVVIHAVLVALLWGAGAFSLIIGT